MPDNPAQQAFKALLEQYYHAWFRFHPEEAVQVGVSGYEEGLRAFSDDDIGALISLNEKALSSLDELDFASLDSEQRLDYSLLYNSIAIELHELLEQDWRYRKPQCYLPVEGIHQLLNRPVEHVHTALKHRLQQIPEYLRAARSYIGQHPERIPASWLKNACQQGTAGARYLRDLYRHPVVMKKFQNPSRLQPLCDQAASALEDYVKFLQQDLASKATGDFACGGHIFKSMLSEAHFLDIGVDELYRFGQQLFDDTRQQLLELTRELRGDDDIEQALASIREDYPRGDHAGISNDVLLGAYRQRMNAACDFVRDKGLASIPASQSLKILPTPEFLRHEIPFAAYEEPTYKDPEQQGYYYVTPVKSEGDMLEHNWVSIDLTCVHEAYPGHHLQFVRANSNPANSLPRLLNASATFYEGWALYCEDLMQEQGFLDRPQHKFIMLRDRLWRAMRVMLDVELHTRGLTIDTAAQRMCTQLGFSIEQARADISWYTESPTVPMGYALGWALIRALREQLSQQPGFILKEFHDKLLSVGSCALPLVIKRAFGEQAWLQARNKVFKI